MEDSVKLVLSAYYRLNTDPGMATWLKKAETFLLKYYSQEELRSGNATDITPEGCPFDEPNCFNPEK